MPAKRKYAPWVCARCAIHKPDPKDWYIRGDSTIPRSWCRACVAEATRIRVLMSRYGITPEEYDAVLVAQGNACAICQKPVAENGRRLAVDHDHKTGQTRGLLCWTCNVALGKFKDNVALIQRAADYVGNPPVTKALGRDVFGRTGRVTKRKIKKRRKK